LKTKSCQNCSFAVQPGGFTGQVLVCANRPDWPGQLIRAKPEDYCRNFQSGKKNSPRQKPPPDSDGVRYIPLTQGRFAIVDADDYDWLNNYKWYAHLDGNKYYAYRHIRRTKRRIAMHRQIMNAPKHLLVDHINGNSQNNRKSNLRVCTKAENVYNRRPSRKCRSGYKGVYWNKHHKKWHVRTTKSGRTFYLGSFNDKIEAAIAYDRKAKELFGEFAYLNFPDLAT
jgi:hypothetical protein